MMENDLILKHKGLIYLAIKKEHLHWKTQDEYQDFVDAGYDGLLNGIRTFNPDKGFKESSYYYACIRHEMIKVIVRKNNEKNSVKVSSLNIPVENDIEIIELIPDIIDIEKEVFDNIRNEKLLGYVNQLKPKDRYVIKMLFGLDGWKQTTAIEIARRWGVNKNTITARRDRALNNLLKRIKKEGL